MEFALSDPDNATSRRMLATPVGVLLVTRKLMIRTGDDVRTFELMDDVTVIGRDDAADLTLVAQNISRRHVQLNRVGDELIVEDLGSSNGTFLDGERLEGKRVFESGAMLQVGDYAVFLDRLPGAAAVDTAAPTHSMTRRGRSKSWGGLVPAALVAAAAFGFYSMLSNPSSENDDDATSRTANLEAEASGADLVDSDASVSELSEGELRAARTRALNDLHLEVETRLLEDAFKRAKSSVREFELTYGTRNTAALRRKIDAAIDIAATAMESSFDRMVRGRQSGAGDYLRDQMSRLPKGSSAFRHLTERLDAFETGAAVAKTETPRDIPNVERPNVTSDTARRNAPKMPTGDGNTSSGRTPTTVAPTSTPSVDTLQAQRTVELRTPEAELAERKADYATAAEIYVELDRLARGGRLDSRITRDLGRRKRTMTKLARFKAALIDAIGEKPEVFTGIPCMPGRRGSIRSATQENITFDINGAPLELPWHVVRDSAMSDIVRKAGFDGTEAVWAAAWHMSTGDDARAHRLLHRAWKTSDATVKSDIDEVVADAVGMDIPDGGFVWNETAYVSPRDLQRVRTRSGIADSIGAIRSKDATERHEAYEGLFALGDRARAQFHLALTEYKKEIIDDLAKSATYEKLEALAARRAELEKTRLRALELIFDEEKYPYPYRGRGPEVTSIYQETQQEINRRVAVVRELWNDKKAVRIPKGVLGKLTLMREIDTQLDRLGVGRGRKTPAFLAHLPLAPQVTIQTYARDADERERIDTSAAWMKDNDGPQKVASRGEQSQVRITNGYRLMMGRHAVKIHDQITRAARMHCVDMNRLGFFAHDNPHEPEKRTPSMRAAMFGYVGSGFSENIAVSGGAQSAHNSWLNSSGHHRNILGKSWRLMGAGNDGNKWCQNFSISESRAFGSSKDEDDDDEDPADDDDDTDQGGVQR